MSDIHQEWKDLRVKNGEFLNHLDCMTAKLEKKQVELERREQMQDMTDAGAFAIQFVAPPPFSCCQDDRDILKALNRAQADRIKSLEDEFLACKEQQKVDQAIKKDLDEKLDKAMADYRALWVENDRLKSQLASEKVKSEEKINNAAKSYARLATERNNLAETISRMEKTIRDLDERNGTLRERLALANASLKRSIQENNKLRSDAAYIETIRKSQAKEIKRLQEIVNPSDGSCSPYTQQGMQSKIAKQANEIKRLTEENEDLKGTTNTLSKMMDASLEDIHNLRDENHNLSKALQIATKDAEVNFNRGRIKGMEEIWDELKEVFAGRPIGENQKIFGYYTVSDILMNLSPTWFINRAEEYHEQEEKKACDIQIGDEVEIFDTFCPDDDPHSDIGIVIAIDKDNPCFAVIGPKFEGCFDETDIENGNVRKTGRHFDSIPLDYFK